MIRNQGPKEDKRGWHPCHQKRCPFPGEPVHMPPHHHPHSSSLCLYCLKSNPISPRDEKLICEQSSCLSILRPLNKACTASVSALVSFLVTGTGREIEPSPQPWVLAEPIRLNSVTTMILKRDAARTGQEMWRRGKRAGFYQLLRDPRQFTDSHCFQPRKYKVNWWALKRFKRDSQGNTCFSGE